MRRLLGKLVQHQDVGLRVTGVMSLLRRGRFSVTARVVTGFVVFAIMVLAVGGTAWLSLSDMRKALHRYFAAGDASRMAVTLEPHFREVDKLVRAALLPAPPETVLKARESGRAFLETLTRDSRKAVEAPDRQSLENAHTAFETYWKGVETALEARAEIERALNEVLYPVAEQMRLRLEQALLAQELPTVRLASQTAVNVMLIRDYVARYLDRHREADAERVRSELTLAKSRLVDLTRSLPPSPLRDQLGGVESSLSLYGASFERLRKAVGETDRLQKDVLEPGSSTVIARISEMAQRPINRDSSLGERLDILTARMAQMTWIVAGICIGVAGVVVWLLTRNLLRPYHGLTHALQAVADGNLDADIPATRRKDEFGELARALQRYRDLRRNHDKRVAEQEQQHNAESMRLRQEADHLKEIERSLREERLSLRDERDRLREEAQTLRAAQDEADSLRAELEQERQLLLTDIDGTRTRLLAEQDAERAQQAAALEAERTRLAVEQQTLQDARHELAGQRQTLESERRQVAAEREGLESESARLREEESKLRTVANRMQDIQLRLRHEAGRLQAHQDRLQNDLKLLHQHQSALQEEDVRIQQESQLRTAEAERLEAERTALAAARAQLAGLEDAQDRIRRGQEAIRQEQEAESARLNQEVARLATEEVRLLHAAEQQAAEAERLHQEATRLAVEDERLRREAQGLALETERLRADAETRQSAAQSLAADEKRLQIREETLAAEEQALARAQATLNTAREKLAEDQQRAHATQAGYLERLGHSLHAPVNAIIRYSQLVLDDVQRLRIWPLAPDVEILSWAGEQLLATVDSGLEMARIDAGALILDNRPLDVAGLLEETRELVAPLAELNGNVLGVECPYDLGPVCADYTRLQAGLLGLLDEACRRTENGEISLAVSVDLEPAPAASSGAPGIDVGQPVIRFTLRDSGRPLSGEELALLRQPFALAQESGQRPFAGHGLGLAMASRFATLAGGRLEARSNDAGTVVELTLPAAADVLRALSALEAAPSEDAALATALTLPLTLPVPEAVSEAGAGPDSMATMAMATSVAPDEEPAAFTAPPVPVPAASPPPSSVPQTPPALPFPVEDNPDFLCPALPPFLDDDPEPDESAAALRQSRTAP